MGYIEILEGETKDFQSLGLLIVPDKDTLRKNLPEIEQLLVSLISKADGKTNPKDLIYTQLHYRRILELGDVFVNNALDWPDIRPAVHTVEQLVIGANHLAKTNKRLAGTTQDLDAIEQLNEERIMALGKAAEWAHAFGLTHWQWKNLSDTLLGEIQENMQDGNPDSIKKLHKNDLSICSLIDVTTQYINQIRSTKGGIKRNTKLSKEEKEQEIKRLEEQRKEAVGDHIVFTNNGACLKMRLGELYSKTSPKEAQKHFGMSQKYLRKSLRRAEKLIQNPPEDPLQQMKNAFHCPGLASNLAHAHLLNLRAITAGRTFDFDEMLPHIAEVDKNLKIAIDFFEDPKNSEQSAFYRSELFLRSAYILLALKWIELKADARKMFMPPNFKQAYEHLIFDTIFKCNPDIAEAAEKLDKSHILTALSDLFIKKVLDEEVGNMDDEDRKFLEKVMAERLKLSTSNFK